MNDRETPFRTPPLTLSMLISEGVYKLVCAIERVIRWFMKNVVRPYLFLLRCLF